METVSFKAKITPKKIGQFVSIWKRIGNGPTLPHDVTDNFYYLVVQVEKDNHRGQFVFPKEVLVQKEYVSQHGKGGKRGMRVYPPWDTVDNPQAQKTQTWQLLYFVKL